MQLCARALVEMEAPVQLQTPAYVLQDGEERSAQQVLCCWLDKPFLRSKAELFHGASFDPLTPNFYSV